MQCPPPSAVPTHPVQCPPPSAVPTTQCSARHPVQCPPPSAVPTHPVQCPLTRCSAHSPGAVPTHLVQCPLTRCSAHSPGAVPTTRSSAHSPGAVLQSPPTRGNVVITIIYLHHTSITPYTHPTWCVHTLLTQLLDVKEASWSVPHTWWCQHQRGVARGVSWFIISPEQTQYHTSHHIFHVLLGIEEEHIQ